jgi:hypothetical protein
VATVWDGFIVFGEFVELLTVLADGETALFGTTDVVVEPALVRTLKDAYVQSITVANYGRTVTALDPECGGSSSADDFRPIVVNATCLQGDISLIEGYNCGIRQDDAANVLIISGNVGGGAGIACEEVPLTDDETTPDDSGYLSGGPRCDQILQTLNGVGGQIVRIVGKTGITVSSDPDDQHGVLISVGLADLANCNTADE